MNDSHQPRIYRGAAGILCRVGKLVEEEARLVMEEAELLMEEARQAELVEEGAKQAALEVVLEEAEMAKELWVRYEFKTTHLGIQKEHRFYPGNNHGAHSAFRGYNRC